MIPGPLAESDYQRLQDYLAQTMRQELWQISRQRMIYLAMSGFSLMLFAVILFVNAQRYQNRMLWVIGFCLVIFSLVEFLELDALHSGKSILQSLAPQSQPMEKDKHGR
ncbi:hypothetical protein COW36_06385 [bacterium (Candidatus Blackallbacteria) CG17_big_fil_post_rev_8_21_14_2_50_48_46]|uniref:Uncharacterized protein n=1 Tax=bacterium (Candidatus Blackallbacteria) CG17_big_fil_post_rev_8_21_14_2_50_48_46 TaxID=2014261 RepID=A0A2M7G826_9BACT|nr:MAG: hypothetical protein COW64_17215 [bacterium (Candidatus Blackallbacteria) CG18_big_fil_WC_8_21_14_2_50_49_26]PIW18153.1 MAG: hypothetical protein COW36_06385 [bacterium (Candidatus Blackallbacteria) CG17_big_fil_post_rev_8_21_14_2_50_48_46]PIW47012.1 MAG: hypothetical protein COW20_13860 [bacterium (Candidatus Blackallbacteria) CG13_big_fil_rev_8_21_14_2_50_49_14]